MIEAYRRALAIDPGFTAAAFDLGVAYYNAGDYQNAEAAYKQVLKYDPDNAQAHANLASTYRQQERYQEANAEYKLAAARITDGDLYSEWGYCLGKTNEWDKAAARLTRAAELTPAAISNSNIAWAYYNYAISQTDPNAARANLELSRAFAEKAIAQDPRLDAAYLNLGSTQNKLGNFQAAINALKIALEIRRDWTIAANQLGIGYRGLGDFVNAIATFKQLTDRDPSYTFGLFNLGEAYNASGDKKSARKVQERLKKLDPTLGNMLSDVFAGKIPVPTGVTSPEAAKQKVVDKVKQKVPRIPY
jgi:tetratricopeptide (TPR) repeat protein